MTDKLRTDWITLCTAAMTVDGREVLPEMIEQAFNTFSFEQYEPNIFEGHPGFFGEPSSLGKVVELRIGKKKIDDENKQTLEGILEPSGRLTSAVRAGQLQYVSVGFTRRDKKWMLDHLAATNLPASVGIQAMNFRKGNESSDHQSSNTEQINRLAFSNQSESMMPVWFKEWWSQFPLNNSKNNQQLSQTQKNTMDKNTDQKTQTQQTGTQKPEFVTDPIQISQKLQSVSEQLEALKSTVEELTKKT